MDFFGAVTAMVMNEPHQQIVGDEMSIQSTRLIGINGPMRGSWCVSDVVLHKTTFFCVCPELLMDLFSIVDGRDLNNETGETKQILLQAQHQQLAGW